jgi:hypothetical protein
MLNWKPGTSYSLLGSCPVTDNKESRTCTVLSKSFCTALQTLSKMTPLMGQVAYSVEACTKSGWISISGRWFIPYFYSNYNRLLTFLSRNRPQKWHIGIIKCFWVKALINQIHRWQQQISMEWYLNWAKATWTKIFGIVQTYNLQYTVIWKIHHDRWKCAKCDW